MKRLRFVACLLVAALASCTTADGQAPPAPNTKLQVSTPSADARAAFWAAWDDGSNVFTSRALMQARKAVRLDSTFGLARVYAASFSNANTGMTSAQREQQLNRGVAEAARATTGELVLAMSMRAWALGRNSEAHTLAAAAVALMPDEPYVSHFRASIAPGDRMPLLLESSRKFPSFAPTYNTVAYAQVAAGDTVTALRTIAEYVRLAPNHPNAHDSYAELLQIAGRYTDAIPHYQRAIVLDSTFSQAYAGIAESHMLMKKYAEAIPYMQRSLAVVPTYAPGHQMIGQAHLLLGQPDLARSTQIAAADKFPTPAAKVGPLVAGALMYVPMGKPKDAIAELVTLATSFEQQDLRGQASATHANAALIEAAFGNRKAVAGHLAKSRAVMPSPAANATPASFAPPMRIRTLTFAMTGQADSAKASAALFAQAVAEGTPAQRLNSRELNAIVAIGEKNFDLAKEELAQAGPGATLGRAMLAEALKKSGRKAEATALKAEILNRNPVLSVYDVIARAKAQKV